MEQNVTRRSIFYVLIEEFENCTDYRDSSRIFFSLPEILFLTFCAVLCGCESYDEIADFGKLKISWLRKYLPYVDGTPSHDTINRGLSVLNPKELEKVLLAVSTYGITSLTGEVIHIDGKSLSGSVTKKEQQTKKIDGGKQVVHTVNVFCSSMKSCLASMKVLDKGGEKEVFKDMLEVLDLSGCLITLDANFCCKDVPKAVKAHEGDYLIGLKENQPKLLAVTKDLLEETLLTEVHFGEEEKGHGRIEKRDCFVLNLSELPAAKKEQYDVLFAEWEGLKSLIKIEATRTIKSTKETTNETRYYISSKEFNPLNANEIIRGHWSIENNLHWVLDIAFGEDESRKRSDKSAFAFSIFRKIAYNKISNFNDPKVSIKRKMKKCVMSEHYLEKVLEIS